MAALPSTQTVVRMVRRPVGHIVPGQDLVAKQEPTPAAADLAEGQVLVHRLFLSLDPAMRGWMRNQPSYVPPVQEGAIMRGGTINEVVASRSDRLRVGEIVLDQTMDGGWSEYAVLQDGPGLSRVQSQSPSQHAAALPLSAHLGVLGGTGLTAYFGLLRVGRPKAGETVLVSGAAGATGSVVCQIAKTLGCTVVGIAGGAEKCAWLKSELGVDATVDYRAAKGDSRAFQKLLRAALDGTKATGGNGGVDVFFDNVGGMILNETLRRLNMRGRVVVCGAISAYNAEDQRAPGEGSLTNYLALISLRARMEGFIVFDYRREYQQAREDLAAWIKDGRLKFKEDVRDGLQQAPEALLSLFNGGNKGKLVCKVGDRLTTSPPPASRL